MRQGKYDLDAMMAKDIDLTGAKFAFVGADGEKSLNGVVGYLGDLGVDAEVFDLDQEVNVRSRIV